MSPLAIQQISGCVGYVEKEKHDCALNPMFLLVIASNPVINRTGPTSFFFFKEGGWVGQLSKKKFCTLKTAEKIVQGGSWEKTEH